MGRGSLTRLTHGGEVNWPLWSPDGERLAFNWLNEGLYTLAWQRTDGTEPPQVLAKDAGNLSSWSPDGDQLATVKDGDIWIATLEGSKATLRPFADTPHREGWPEFSPDGRWLAYASDDSGRNEVYVQPFPGPGPFVIQGAASNTTLPPVTHIHLVQNWLEEVKARVPTRR